ncbi:MAG: hypothetical protein H0T78_12285 [Longispora sp.]|nr:hypothetical protein [Longispora sp. (in: high G+C Gram-positive bacteria)]
MILEAEAAIGLAWTIGKDLYGTPGHLKVNKPEENAATYKLSEDDSIPAEVLGNYVVYLTYIRRTCWTKAHPGTWRIGNKPAHHTRKPKLRVELALYYQLVKAGTKSSKRHRPVHIRHCHLEVADGKRRNLFGEESMINFTIQCNNSDRGPFLLWTWEATTNGRSFLSRGTESSGTFSLFTDNTFVLAAGDSQKYFQYQVERAHGIPQKSELGLRTEALSAGGRRYHERVDGR